MRTYAFLLLFSTVTSYLLTRWLARVAGERGWTRNESSNDAAVPRLGGVAICVTCFAALALLWIWQNQVSQRFGASLPLALGLAGAAGAVFALGLYDDLRGARPWQKLLVQGAAGLALYAAGFRIEILSNPFNHQPIELGAFSLPLTLLWLVAISNAFNLIDGLDGLAAGVGVFATLALFLLSVLQSRSFEAATAAALAGALFGFLPHNFNPARIYLGDSGALTIGMVLAALAIAGSQKGPVLVTLAIPLMIFGLPLLDVSVTTLRRFLSGHPIFHRDEEHLHHRLMQSGLSTRHAVLILYGIAALFALASLLVVNSRGAVGPLVAVLCGILAWVVVRQMQYPEFSELDSHVRWEWRSQRTALRAQIQMRKAAIEFSQAETVESLWAISSRVFDSLDIDVATLEFARGIGNAPLGAPRALRWTSGSLQDSFAPLPTAESAWTIALPLRRHGNYYGTLRLTRSLDRGPFLFRMSRVVEFFSNEFAAHLDRIAESQTVEHRTIAAAGM